MHKIIDNIYWTGYIDWDLRNFHGYETPVGSTYNSYLILDEAPTLIDTVKYYGAEEMIDRIKEVIDPAKIKYVISNHTEMDHSGSIDAILKYCPNAEVVCSPKGAEELKRHFKKDWKFKIVNTGDELKIGKRTLSFLLTPMVHWPDSMATYSAQDKILFSNDAFGQHRASAERYADEVGSDIVFEDAAKYYANIVMPYGAQVLKALDAASKLDIEMICPSHGLIWRTKENIEKIVSLYQRWASYESDDKCLIVYDTMWNSTRQMATKLNHFVDVAGIPVKMVGLQEAHISDIVTDVLMSKFVLFGTPILNNRMLPTMAALLMYLKGLKTKNRYATTFGSYGWSKIGFKEFEQSIVDAGFELMDEGKYSQFVPDEDELELLKIVVDKIKERIK
ncbi:MAG: FprA family A-type flavoprotein [Candidatus Omnitrophica bacterium]|nr:FprA family A-type flavoprotein [Candidatus Omnitrophota bacterium]